MRRFFLCICLQFVHILYIVCLYLSLRIEVSKERKRAARKTKMTKKIYKGTVNAAYYQAPFDHPIHVTFKDGIQKKFEAIYFDNALDFFRDHKYEACEWCFDERNEMYLTL